VGGARLARCSSAHVAVILLSRRRWGYARGPLKTLLDALIHRSPRKINSRKSASHAIAPIPQGPLAKHGLRYALRECMLTVVEENYRQDQTIYAPRDVAARLRISGQRVRQLAAVYEQVYGNLPRDERGRVWPEEAVERLDWRTRPL
jgi:hypothetical protein